MLAANICSDWAGQGVFFFVIKKHAQKGTKTRVTKILGVEIKELSFFYFIF